MDDYGFLIFMDEFFGFMMMIYGAYTSKTDRNYEWAYGLWMFMVSTYHLNGNLESVLYPQVIKRGWLAGKFPNSDGGFSIAIFDCRRGSRIPKTDRITNN